MKTKGTGQLELLLMRPAEEAGQGRGAMNVGHKYKALWNRYLDLVAAFEGGIDKLCDEGGDLFDSHLYTSPEKTMSRVLDALVQEAARMFSPPGGNLAITDNGLTDKFYDPYRQNYRRFDPEAIWAHLEKNYGGGKGEEIGHSQAAAEIVRKFSITTGMEMERKGGCVVLRRWVWLDSFSRTMGKTLISYRCQEDITSLMTHLRGFAAWAGFKGMVAACHPETMGISCGDRTIKSRAKFDLGDGLTVVTFHENFEFRFPLPMAEQLQIFLATFCPDMGDEEAA